VGLCLELKQPVQILQGLKSQSSNRNQSARIHSIKNRLVYVLYLVEAQITHALRVPESLQSKRGSLRMHTHGSPCNVLRTWLMSRTQYSTSLVSSTSSCALSTPLSLPGTPAEDVLAAK
jgi:hypothetical protein